MIMLFFEMFLHGYKIFISTASCPHESFSM